MSSFSRGRGSTSTTAKDEVGNCLQHPEPLMKQLCVCVKAKISMLKADELRSYDHKSRRVIAIYEYIHLRIPLLIDFNVINTIYNKCRKDI